MKTAAKVFLCIKCGLYTILFISLCFLLKYIDSDYYMSELYRGSVIFSIFLIIISYAIGVIAETKLKKAKSKKELLVIGILTLLFFDLLTGIFMLCITDDELSKENTKSESDNQPTPPPKKIEDETTKIEDAEKLFKSGIITEEEYQTIRINIINKQFL